MIRKLAFHEISQKLPFQGNKVKLQLADNQVAAILFCHICTTFAQQNYKIPFKIHRHSPSFTTAERFCIF
jgi:hypothetical protein